MTALTPNATALFGWPSTTAALPSSSPWHVLGVPTDMGNAVFGGPRLGPQAIRRASARLPALAASGVDLGDLAHARYLALEDVIAQLRSLASDVHVAGSVPVLLGGDHSLAYGPIAALAAHQPICVVWFDAHTDFSEWHGGDGCHDHKQVLRRVEALPGVARVLQVGFRGITVGDERRLGPKSTVVTTAAARRISPGALLELIPKTLPCYLSIDIDVLDPFLAPGTSAPVPDGLDAGTLGGLLAAIARARRLIGLDLVEVNPTLDIDDRTSRLGAELLHRIFSAARTGDMEPPDAIPNEGKP